ncbi:MAG TPA: MFS transporter [Candidatus Paceibacterota bacterium]|nr:MFS transporter [Candidatus Paceibacterota bacterium]
MNPRVVLSVGNFFFSVCSTATFYVLLPFLAQYMPAAYAGLVVALGAVIALIVFLFLPALVAKFGAQQLALLCAILEMLAFFALAAEPGAVAAVFLVAVTVAVEPLLAYELDLLLEATVAEEGTTGRVRTLFLTAWNVAALGAPLLMGALLDAGNAYGRVFLAAAGALVPFVVLFAARKLPSGRPPKLRRLRDTLLQVARMPDLAAVTYNHLLLYLFYVWAPLYIPLYLHNSLHIAWNDLGWMFALMLIPFVLIEYPAGWAADNWWGDKEMMFAGFVIMGSALALVGEITAATPLLVILAVLLVSRVGAALVESMTEGHFFRRVSEEDVELVSVFRGIWPVSDLIAPVAGSLILFFGNFEILFAVSGIFIAVTGVVATSFIRDFR